MLLILFFLVIVRAEELKPDVERNIDGVLFKADGDSGKVEVEKYDQWTYTITVEGDRGVKISTPLNKLTKFIMEYRNYLNNEKNVNTNEYDVRGDDNEGVVIYKNGKLTIIGNQTEVWDTTFKISSIKSIVVKEDENVINIIHDGPSLLSYVIDPFEYSQKGANVYIRKDNFDRNLIDIVGNGNIKFGPFKYLGDGIVNFDRSYQVFFEISKMESKALDGSVMVVIWHYKTIDGSDAFDKYVFYKDGRVLFERLDNIIAFLPDGTIKKRVGNDFVLVNPEKIKDMVNFYGELKNVRPTYEFSSRGLFRQRGAGVKITMPSQMNGITIYTNNGREIAYGSVDVELVNRMKLLTQELSSKGVVGIYTMGAYVRRNIRGTNTPSEHSFGKALDISGFLFEDGSSIRVTQNRNPQIRNKLDFFGNILRKYFPVVLDWRYNSAHYDHFHVNI